jgi:uncharacterized CHY-type Zn-finger protein
MHKIPGKIYRLTKLANRLNRLTQEEEEEEEEKLPLSQETDFNMFVICKKCNRRIKVKESWKKCIYCNHPF